MAALSATAVPVPRPDPNTPILERIYKCDAADTFYLGSIACVKNGDGHVYLTNADADWALGFCTKYAVTLAQDDPVTIAFTGIWWISAVAILDAGLLTLVHPLAASDNPADVVLAANAATNPGALGTLVHVDVTATSGWVDLDMRIAPTNS